MVAAQTVLLRGVSVWGLSLEGQLAVVVDEVVGEYERDVVGVDAVDEHRPLHGVVCVVADRAVTGNRLSPALPELRV